VGNTRLTRLTHDCSGSKCKTAAGAAEYELFRYFLTGEINEVLLAAMHRHHVIEIELLQLDHDLAQIVVGRRRQMKAADERVNLFDAADLLSTLQRVDDPAMPA
jgi:hypothetical protein